jgi:flagellar protein FliS
MFSPAKSFASAYRTVDAETSVAHASPHQLVTLLFDAALAAIATARGAIQRGDIALKGKQIAKAVRIIEEGLRGGLNRSAGGALAGDLAALYAYLVQRLTLANVRNDDAALAESHALLSTVREGWVAIPAQQRAV